jgi:hypothetical protein
MKIITSDTTTILYLHQSDIGTLRMCPEQARLQLTGEYFDPSSDAAAIGTRVHEFIEWCLHYRQDHGMWPDNPGSEVERQQRLLAEEWDSLWLHPHMVADLDQGTLELEDCCQRWYNILLPQISTTNVAGWEIEKRFDVHVDSGLAHRNTFNGVTLYSGDPYEIRIRGSVDFFDGVNTIWDWKTGRFTRSNGWKLDRYDIQAPMYTYARHLTLPNIGSGPVSFNFGYVPRGGKGAEVWDLSLGPDKWGMMLDEVKSWGHTIMKLGTEDRWPLGPNEWHCSPRWCSEFALGKCRGAHEEGFWPGEVSTVVELKRKVDAGLVPGPKEHHPDKETE